MTSNFPATAMSTEYVDSGATGGHQSLPPEESKEPSDGEDVGREEHVGTGRGCTDEVPDRLNRSNTGSQTPLELHEAKPIVQVPEIFTEYCMEETAETDMERPEGVAQAERGGASGNPSAQDYLQVESAEKQGDDPAAALLTLDPIRSRSTSVSSTLSNLHQVGDAAVFQPPSQEGERESLASPTPKSARDHADPKWLGPYSEEIRRFSTARQSLRKELQEIKDKFGQLQEDNENNSSIPEESGLSYYDEGRVKEKFRITAASIEKTLFEIQKAEELLQCLSVANCQLQRDVDLEGRYGEKLRQLQEEVRSSCASLSEAERHFRDARAFKRRMIPLDIGLLRTILPADITKDIATLKDFIMKNVVTARFAQIAFAGLPYSGKSTLFKGIVGDTAPTNRDLTIQEAVLLQHDISGFWRWICSDKEDAELVAILGALAQVTPVVCTVPDPDLEKENVRCVGHDAHLKRTLGRLQQLMKTRDFADTLFQLKNSVLTFVNVWDVGVSKPAFELLPILAPDVRNLILVNLIHLARDALPDKLDGPPQLHNEELYSKRYQDCGNLLRRRSILHYYLRCIPPSCQALLVGTCANKLPESDLSAILQNLQKRIRLQAREMHVEGAISNEEILAVDVDNPDDAEKVKKAIEKLVLDKRYEKKVPLSWIFLRCALLGRMYVRKMELIDIAEKCGVQDLEEWLDLFQSCLSIICLSRKVVGFPDDDYIVLDPLKFFRGLNRLYFADQQDEIPDELREDVEYVKFGILPDALLKLVCKDEEDSCNLYLGLLQSLGFLTQVDTPLQGYFFPSLRREHCPGNKLRSPNSLFIRYPKEVPFDNQATLFRSIVKHFPGKIEIGNETCYNVLLFHWSDGSGDRATIRIRFLLCFAEVSVTAPAGLQPHLARWVKSACIEAFEVTKDRHRHLDYNLALVCPNDACLEDENIFVNIGTPTCELESLICSKCGGDVANGDRKLWAQWSVVCLH